MHVRPATREDIEAFSEISPKPTMRAWAGEVDGEIVALGGFAIVKGRWLAFCDLNDEARKYKMHIMRTAKKALKQAREDGARFVYAEVSDEEPGALRWLKSLGFTRDLRTAYLYRWRA